MLKRTVLLASTELIAEGDALSCQDAQVLDFVDVAQRRERLTTYVGQTRGVIVYRFVLPHGAVAASLGPGRELRDARDQLQLIVGLTGGGLTGSHGGLAARIPKTLAPRFEALARPLSRPFLSRWIWARSLGPTSFDSLRTSLLAARCLSSKGKEHGDEPGQGTRNR